MKFNVVALNPPYNKGMDLDFIAKAYEICADYTIAITPAKWQTAEGDQRIASEVTYKKFRETYVPHMSHVVFYPDCYDIFAISEPDGITYYMLDKHKDITKPCKVINKCKHKDIINSVEYRDICNRQTLFNVGNKVIESMGMYNKLQIKAIRSHKYQVNINKQMTVGEGGFSTRELGDDGKWHVRKDIVGNGSMLFSITDGTLTVIGNPKIIDNTTEYSQSSINIFSSNSLDECKYFYSFIGCKLIKFLVFMNISSLACVGNAKTWRFVPAPPSGKFDHIYTDEELYKTFNIYIYINNT